MGLFIRSIFLVYAETVFSILALLNFSLKVKVFVSLTFYRNVFISRLIEFCRSLSSLQNCQTINSDHRCNVCSGTFSLWNNVEWLHLAALRFAEKDLEEIVVISSNFFSNWTYYIIGEMSSYFTPRKETTDN